MTRTLATCAAAALLLALSACSSDPEPRFAQSSPTAATPREGSPESPDAEDGAPPLPSSASRPTAAGAEAFVRHFWDVVNYAQTTSSTEELGDLVDSGCAGCAGAINLLDETFTNSGKIRGGQYTIRDLDVNKLSTPSSSPIQTPVADATFIAHNTPQLVIRDGKREKYPASDIKVQFTMTFVDRAWKVDTWLAE